MKPFFSSFLLVTEVWLPYFYDDIDVIRLLLKVWNTEHGARVLLLWLLIFLFYFPFLFVYDACVNIMERKGWISFFFYLSIFLEHRWSWIECLDWLLSNAALACDPNTGTIAYPAGYVWFYSFVFFFKFHAKRKDGKMEGASCSTMIHHFFSLAAPFSSPINWKWFGFQLPIIISSWCPLSLLYTCLFFSSSAYLAAFSSGHFLGVFQRDDESAQQIFTARFEESSSPCRLIPWWRWSAVADYSLSCCSLGVFQHLSVPFFDVFFHVHLIVVINLTDVLCCSTHARTAKLTLSTRLESG